MKLLFLNNNIPDFLEKSQNIVKCLDESALRWRWPSFKHLIEVEIWFGNDMGIAKGRCHQFTEKTYCVDLLDNMSVSQTTLTFAHELRHIYQYVTRNLQDVHNVRLWNGKPGYQKLPHKDRPWEKDAIFHSKNLLREMEEL